MKKFTRSEVKKLAPEIIAAFHDAGQKCDVAAFKRLLGQYAAHLSSEKKNQLIEDFKRYADALRASLRGER